MKLGAVGMVCDLRLSDGGRMVSTGEKDEWLVERGDAQRNLEIGWEMTTRLECERIEERGVEGQP